MTGRRDTPGYAEALAKIDKALQHVFAICKGDERWTMRIPARPDTDSDLIICDALETARKLLAVPSETALRGACHDAAEEQMGCFRAVRAERLQREAEAKLDLREKQLLECQHQLITRNDELALAMRSAELFRNAAPGANKGSSTGSPVACTDNGAAPITQTPGELATAPQADTLGSGLTAGRDPHEQCFGDPHG